MNCPACGGSDLRRGIVSHQGGRHRVYHLSCARCGSYFIVPQHEYFQVYSHRQSQGVKPERKARA
jgi:transcription elongation factor Elf1